MKKEDVSIVICCAGMGTRLGIGSTKALVDICGIPLIIHQLEQLKEYDDIRIVVGYQAKKLIDVVNKYRKDIMFVFNYEYDITGPAASLYKGILGSRKYTVMLDGDLITKPYDFKKFMESEGEKIASTNITSDEPVLMELQDHNVLRFSEKGNVEWPGLARILTERITKCDNNIYEILGPLLPIESMHVGSRDIDTPDDYERAILWVKSRYID